MTTIQPPRSRVQGSGSTRVRRPRAGGNFELNSWLFMRGSGMILVVLVIGHLFVNLMVGKGIERIDFAFVAGKWASPFWQTWDLAMLWLAELHGANGLRTIINDYTTSETSRFVLKTLLYFSALIILVLGTLVIFTFDPCGDPGFASDNAFCGGN